MPRWLRVLRGKIGTGLTFAVAGPVVSGAIGSIAWLLGDFSFGNVIFIALRTAPLSFLVGVAFSGALVLTARGRSFEKLSLPRFAGLGAAAGLLLYALMALGASSTWSASDAVVNLLLMTAIGGGAAAAALLLARRGETSTDSGNDVLSLGEGAASPLTVVRDPVKDHVRSKPPDPR